MNELEIYEKFFDEIVRILRTDDAWNMTEYAVQDISSTAENTAKELCDYYAKRVMETIYP